MIGFSDDLHKQDHWRLEQHKTAEGLPLSAIASLWASKNSLYISRVARAPYIPGIKYIRPVPS